MVNEIEMNSIKTNNIGWGAWFGLACLLGLSLAPASAAAALSATVDRLVTQAGQSITLTVSIQSGQAGLRVEGAPDFSVLRKDFDILSQSMQSRTHITNGATTAVTSWVLQLMPAREGKLTIPSLSYKGESTEAIDIDVLAGSQGATSGAEDLSVSFSVDNESPWVQAQTLAVVKVHYAIPLLDGSLSSPEAPDLIVQRIGEDRQYRETVNGRMYSVLERRFALFPQRSGKITIPPIVLDASVPTDGRSRSGIFTPSSQRRLRSEPLDLQVQARPEDADGLWWLPASEVSLAQRWEGDLDNLIEGGSITRVIELSAIGVDGTQLPDIPVPEGDGFSVYADQPEVNRHTGSDGVRSTKTLRWVIVPQRAGELSLSPIKLDWFDTTDESRKVAMLDAETLQVKPAAPTTAESPEDIGVARSQSADIESSPARSATGGDHPAGVDEAGLVSVRLAELEQQLNLWRNVAFAALLLLILLSSWLFWQRFRSRRRPQGVDQPQLAPVSAADELRAVEQACQQRDLDKISEHALAWSSTQWPEDPPRTLPALANRIDQSPLSDKLRSIDAGLYRQQPDLADLEALPALLKSFRGNGAGAVGSSSALPEL